MAPRSRSHRRPSRHRAAPPSHRGRRRRGGPPPAGPARGTRGRRRKPPVRRRRGRLGRLASVLTTLLGLVTAAGVLVVLRTDRFSDHTVANVDHGSVSLRQVPRPVTGRPLTVTTPEGDSYTVAAVRGATGEAPLSGLPAPPPGKGYAFIDYVLTNPHRRPVLLDFPPNVFLRRAVVPADFAERCVFRVGAPEDVCDLPGRTRVIARLRGSAGLLRQDADVYMAPGASYLVRAVAEAPVLDGVGRRDMGLYVWEVRFTRDRIARRVPFPG